ncbi:MULTISPECIES: hypothetical protein [Streptomyces]|uniref:hypothetical protein n=1 Tax=Streptomyces TaxID=1883 RepID=UPI002F95C31A
MLDVVPGTAPGRGEGRAGTSRLLVRVVQMVKFDQLHVLDVIQKRLRRRPEFA